MIRKMIRKLVQVSLTITCCLIIISCASINAASTQERNFGGLIEKYYLGASVKISIRTFKAGGINMIELEPADTRQFICGVGSNYLVICAEGGGEPKGVSIYPLNKVYFNNAEMCERGFKCASKK